MQKRQLVFKFLLFSILFEIPLKFTNVKFLLQFYNLMSLDKNKNLSFCLQVILKLQTLFGASKPLCHHVSSQSCVLRGCGDKGLGWRDWTERDPCLLFKTSKSIFQWNYQKEKSPIHELSFLGIVFTYLYGTHGNFSLCF